MNRVCLQCGDRTRSDRYKGFFCNQRCATKWAVTKAEGEYDWCEKHKWHMASACSSCYPIDLGFHTYLDDYEEDSVEEQLTPEQCPDCFEAGGGLVPHLQFYYVEAFDDGSGEAHGRLYLQTWYCEGCLKSFSSYEVFGDLYDEDRTYEIWEEAWRKLGVERITVLCAGPKPSYHRVFPHKDPPTDD